MLLRFRMSVDDCIAEYEKIGEKVFGSPRLPVVNRLRPKFDEKGLESAIKDVCERHGEHVPWNAPELSFNLEDPSDDDMCKWFA